MAAGSAADIPTQLAALLSRESLQIRRTDQNPPQASIYDVISAVTGLNSNHAGKAYRDLTARYPEVHSPGVNFRFPGRGQRDTPVANVRGIVEIIMLLPGQQAARVRRQAAELLCRYLGGDVALVDETQSGQGGDSPRDGPDTLSSPGNERVPPELCVEFLVSPIAIPHNP